METPPEYAQYPRYSTDPRRYFGPPDVRFDAISEAWAMLWSDAGTWVVMGFLALLLAFTAQLPSQIYQFTQQMAAPQDRTISTRPDVLVATVVGALASGVISQLLIAGIYRTAILRFRGQQSSIGDMFQLNGMAPQVMLYAVIIQAVSLLFTLPLAHEMNSRLDPLIRGTGDPAALLGLAAILLVGSLLALALMSLLMLTPAIIVDQKMPAFAAMKLSWTTLAPRFWKAFGVYFSAALLGGIGVVGCCVGLLFTLPVFFLTVAIIYRDHFVPAVPSMQPSETPTAPWTGGFQT